MRCRLLFIGAITVALVWVAAVTADEPARATTLAEKLAVILDRPEYETAHWGLLVVQLSDGEVLYERNAERLFAPASVTKLFSVAAALAEFGPEHRFETRVVHRGELRASGTLAGDLILLANGDLSLGGRTQADGTVSFRNVDHTYANGSTAGETTEEDALAGLKDLAKQVAAAGVKRIQGDILIDDRLFDRTESTGSGPTRVVPIAINDNLLDLWISPAEAGQPAKVEWGPRTAAVTMDCQIQTGPAGGLLRVVATQPRAGCYLVRGSIPADHKPVLRVVEVDEPIAFARSLFIDCLHEAGVQLDASGLQGNRADLLPERSEVAKLPVIARYSSPPFSEEAKLVLKVSHNLHASALPLLIASRHGGRSLQSGLARIGMFLRQAGVQPTQASFGSGAGGSRGDFVTPRGTVALLQYMARQPYFESYEAALPILGVDGTLHDVVDATSPARGQVRAKTGTYLWQNGLNGRYVLISKALAGYMTTAKDQKLAFAFFVNGTHLALPTQTKREGRALGELCEVLYAHE